ncbi:hypothetical protein B0H17DRAFT_1206410 [Mycena rosella]|uniref:Uncharacterized protein n=1 Tax=Mycena rosella TaxID=1033263 RepID=A0AAD7D549_MYCRO|nr:hypothetical protein B0H17DRAFT_1206410 [Mycena rosella]
MHLVVRARTTLDVASFEVINSPKREMLFTLVIFASLLAPPPRSRPPAPPLLTAPPCPGTVVPLGLICHLPVSIWLPTFCRPPALPRISPATLLLAAPNGAQLKINTPTSISALLFPVRALGGRIRPHLVRAAVPHFFRSSGTGKLISRQNCVLLPPYSTHPSASFPYLARITPPVPAHCPYRPHAARTTPGAPAVPTSAHCPYHLRAARTVPAVIFRALLPIPHSLPALVLYDAFPVHALPTPRQPYRPHAAGATPCAVLPYHTPAAAPCCCLWMSAVHPARVLPIPLPPCTP